MFFFKRNSQPTVIDKQTEYLDQAQADLDARKTVLTEDQAWAIQATIDRRRFDVELDRLVQTAYRPK